MNYKFIVKDSNYWSLIIASLTASDCPSPSWHALHRSKLKRSRCRWTSTWIISEYRGHVINILSYDPIIGSWDLDGRNSIPIFKSNNHISRCLIIGCCLRRILISYRPRSELQRVISSRSIYGISSRLDLIYLRSEIETYTKSLPDSVTRYLLGNRFPYLRALIPLYKMPSWSAGGTIFLINWFCIDLSFYETVAPAYDLG